MGLPESKNGQEFLIPDNKYDTYLVVSKTRILDDLQIRRLTTGGIVLVCALLVFTVAEARAADSSRPEGASNRSTPQD